MTRDECESKILDLVRQIRSVVIDYFPDAGIDGNGDCCMAAGKDWISFFLLDKDDNYQLRYEKFEEEG